MVIEICLRIGRHGGLETLEKEIDLPRVGLEDTWIENAGVSICGFGNSETTMGLLQCHRKGNTWIDSTLLCNSLDGTQEQVILGRCILLNLPVATGKSQVLACVRLAIVSL